MRSLMASLQPRIPCTPVHLHHAALLKASRTMRKSYIIDKSMQLLEVSQLLQSDRDCACDSQRHPHMHGCCRVLSQETKGMTV